MDHTTHIRGMANTIVMGEDPDTLLTVIDSVKDAS